MTALLFRDDAYRRSCVTRVSAVHADGIELEHTVFYPMGGGQPGDSGVLRSANGTVTRIVDTRRGGTPERIVHVASPGSAMPQPGDELEASIDWERRYRHMRLHTGMHLLCAVVKAPVTGGRISEDKAHLDFDIDMERLVKDTIERGLNELVAAGIDTCSRWVSDAELDANPQLVKTMSVAPPRGDGRVRLLDIPGVDLQACGGTHVANTREVGALVVTRIRSEGRRNRRVTLGFGEAH